LVFYVLGVNSSAAMQPRVLSDVASLRLGKLDSRVKNAVLILGGALLTTAMAQISFKLSWTPVPITGQTFGVLVAGTALGSWRGAASQALYWLMGLALPVYASSGGSPRSGWDVASGTTFGYFAGFVVAAGVVGYLAERKQDRNFATSLSAMLLGSVIIYVLGALWLSHKLNIPMINGEKGADAMSYGVTPFLIGDLAKAILAGAVTPAAWQAVKKFSADK
jgi:biotin transport system substrate-specific component